MQMGVTALSRGTLSSIRCNMVAWVFSTWRCWAGPYVSGGSGYKKLMLQGHGLDSLSKYTEMQRLSLMWLWYPW